MGRQRARCFMLFLPLANEKGPCWGSGGQKMQLLPVVLSDCGKTFLRRPTGQTRLFWSRRAFFGGKTLRKKTVFFPMGRACCARRAVPESNWGSTDSFRMKRPPATLAARGQIYTSRSPDIKTHFVVYFCQVRGRNVRNVRNVRLFGS